MESTVTAAVDQESRQSESHQVSQGSTSTSTSKCPLSESLDSLPKLLSKYHLRHLTKNRATVPTRRLPSSSKIEKEPLVTLESN